MEKGVKNLQSIARTARKTSAPSEDIPAPNKEEHEGDSGIGCSDAELEPADTSRPAIPPPTSSASIHVVQPALGLTPNQQTAMYHILPRPPPLPLYQPPPTAHVRSTSGSCRYIPAGPSVSSPPERERTPGNSTQRSVSIQSMLSHTPVPTTLNHNNE